MTETHKTEKEKKKRKKKEKKNGSPFSFFASVVKDITAACDGVFSVVSGCYVHFILDKSAKKFTLESVFDFFSCLACHCGHTLLLRNDRIIRCKFLFFKGLFCHGLFCCL